MHRGPNVAHGIGFGKHEYGRDGLGLSRDALDEPFSDYRSPFAEYPA